MPAISRDSLLTLEAYSRVRQAGRPQAMAHRRLRSVALGAHFTLQFEDEATIRRQIQEMLHAEKVFDEAGIQAEIDAYAHLLPDGSHWTATLLIAYPDAQQRQRELARLAGLEHHIFVAVQGHAAVHATANEDLDPAHAGTPSAVHFLRFQLGAATRQAVLAGAAVSLGCDHPQCALQVAIAPATLASLAADLRP